MEELVYHHGITLLVGYKQIVTAQNLRINEESHNRTEEEVTSVLGLPTYTHKLKDGK